MKQILLAGVLGLIVWAVPSSVLIVAAQQQPPLDISGIAIIQAIPVGGADAFGVKKSDKNSSQHCQFSGNADGFRKIYYGSKTSFNRRKRNYPGRRVWKNLKA